MADQNITALPVTEAPATTDQLLLVGQTEERLIDYNKLADAILNKLTSKAFALDQGSKTLLAALDELNSKTKRVEFNIPISRKAVISFDGCKFAAILALQATLGDTYGMYALNGYGDGTSIRFHFASLHTVSRFLLEIDKQSFIVTNESTNDVSASVSLLLGNLPDIVIQE